MTAGDPTVPTGDPTVPAGELGDVDAAEARVVDAVRTRLWSELGPLAERFAEAGHRLYLVGGTVRDLLVGADGPMFDLDATTTATPSEIKRLLAGWADALWTQGERFGTIGAAKDLPGAGAAGSGVRRIYEITTHRAEAYAGHSRKPDVVFSDDVVADLSRRDFTVNAMAVELTTSAPRLVDPFGGVRDLGARVLRTPLTPVESFADDPLRMLRAARFVTRYGLEPVPELVEAVRSMGSRMAIVSAERVHDELDKLLQARSPRAGIRFLADTALLGRAVPRLGRLDAQAVSRTIATVEAVAPVPEWVGAPASLRLVRWAAFVLELDPAEVRSVLRALRASGDDVRVISSLVATWRTWFVAASEADWPAPDVRRLVRDAGDHLAEVVGVARAVEQVRIAAGDVVARPVAALVRRRAALAAEEDLSDLGPGLGGEEVMRVLGVPPGRVVGDALAFLTELRLEVGPSDREQLIEHLRKWWTDHSK